MVGGQRLAVVSSMVDSITHAPGVGSGVRDEVGLLRRPWGYGGSRPGTGPLTAFQYYPYSGSHGKCEF